MLRAWFQVGMAQVGIAGRLKPLFLVALLVLAVLPTEAVAQAPLGRSVTMYEWDFVLDAASAPAGDISFSVNNQGRFNHEVAVIRSDAAVDGLETLAATGLIDETKATPIRRIRLSAGTASVLTTNLPAGRYLLVCNLVRTPTTGHYRSGMAIALTVGPTGAALAAPSKPPIPAGAVAPAVAAAAPAQAPVPPKTGSAGLAGGQASSMTVLALLALAVIGVAGSRVWSARASSRTR